MSRVLTGALIGAASMISAIALLALALGPAGSTQAGSSGVNLALDANASGNTATSVGTIESCAQVAAGGTIVIDVVAQNIPPFDGGGGGLAGFGFNIVYDETKLDITARATPLDATKSLLATEATSSVSSFTDTVPDSTINAANLGYGNFQIVELDQDSVYESGSGRIFSFTVSVLGSASAGNTVLDLTDVMSKDELAGGDGDGNPELYNSDTSIYDATVGDATLSIGQACGAGGTPTPTPAPTTPGVTPSPTQPPTPTPTLPPGETPTPTQPPTPTPTPCTVDCPSITPSPTPSPTQPPTPTPTSTPTPTASPTQAPTPTATPTPTPTAGATGTKTASPTPSKTAAGLPQTGGGTSDGGFDGWMVLLLLGTAAIVVSGGSLVTARSRRD